MSEDYIKQVWDNFFQKLNEEEKTFLSLMSNEKNKEIERLNKNNQAYQKELCKVWAERDNAYRIINELEKSWKEEITRFNNFIQEDSSMIEINNIRKMLIQEREKDLYKLQELKGSDK